MGAASTQKTSSKTAPEGHPSASAHLTWAAAGLSFLGGFTFANWRNGGTGAETQPPVAAKSAENWGHSLNQYTYSKAVGEVIGTATQPAVETQHQWLLTGDSGLVSNQGLLKRRWGVDQFKATILRRDKSAYKRHDSIEKYDPNSSTLTIANRSEAVLVFARDFLVRVPEDIDSLFSDVMEQARRLQVVPSPESTLSALFQRAHPKASSAAEKQDRFPHIIIAEDGIHVVDNGFVRWVWSSGTRRFLQDDGETELAKITSELGALSYVVALCPPIDWSDPIDTQAGLYGAKVDNYWSCAGSYWDERNRRPWTREQNKLNPYLGWEVTFDSERRQVAPVQLAAKNGKTISGLGFWRDITADSYGNLGDLKASRLVCVNSTQIAPDFDVQGQHEARIIEVMASGANGHQLGLASGKDLAFTLNCRWPASPAESTPEGDLYLTSDGLCAVTKSRESWEGYIRKVPLAEVRARINGGDFRVVLKEDK